MAQKTVLVLGAYGLAGRGIVQELVRASELPIRACGRDESRLAEVGNIAPDQIETVRLDARDDAALQRLCERAAVVVNAVGPYAKDGARIAAAVVRSKRHYIDCASEQVHFHRLKALRGEAERNAVLMVTGTGAIPGISGLLAAELLENFPAATDLNMYWAQFRHAHAGTGLGSFMTGVLEAASEPKSLSGGKLTTVHLGDSAKPFELPPPFGKLSMIEVPSLETLTLSERHPMQELHAWYHFGDLPAWLFKLIRILKPHKRDWAYNLLYRITKSVNEKEFNKAVAAGYGPESLLYVTASNTHETRDAYIRFKDGAIATAVLPARIAVDIINDRIMKTGLATPLHIYAPEDLPMLIKDATREAAWPN